MQRRAEKTAPAIGATAWEHEINNGTKPQEENHRQGISLIELQKMFPTEEAAADWFADKRWGNGYRPCPICNHEHTAEVKNGPLPYRCKGCWKYFSVRTGTVLECSKVSLQNWAYALYLCTTNLKGISSMELHRDIGVPPKTAWFMLHRIREALQHPDGFLFSGPVEVDETFVGGKQKNKHSKRDSELGGARSVRRPLWALETARRTA